MTRSVRNRGGVYLLVLVSATVTMSIGMLAITANAAQREVQELAIQRERAVSRAESAIHLALDAIASDDAWRSRGGGRVLGPLTMDRGRAWTDASDPGDDDLADEPLDPFTLTATATYGEAKQRIAADFEVEIVPVEALEYALVASGGVTNTGELELDFGPLSVEISAFMLASLNPWSGSRDMDEIQMPDPGVVTQYAAMGTVLPTSLSNDGAGILYEDLLLTGTEAQSKEGKVAANTDGVYVINGRGRPVRLTKPRIVGTLVVVNASSLELTQPATMRPASEGFPVLLTAAPLTIDGASSDDTDKAIPDDDDNPEGPDFDDPSFDGVQGIIYADNNVSLFNGLDMHGTLMATGQVFVTGDVSIKRNDAFLEAPPPGFRAGTNVRLVAGSWRRVID